MFERKELTLIAFIKRNVNIVRDSLLAVLLRLLSIGIGLLLLARRFALCCGHGRLKGWNTQMSGEIQRKEFSVANFVLSWYDNDQQEERAPEKEKLSWPEKRLAVLIRLVSASAEEG